MDKKVILIADDIEMNRTVLKKFIGKDFEILEAEDGLQVMRILEERPVDAILLDIVMPVMDGLQVLERIQNTMESRPFGILVATSTKEKTERAALSLGADDIVSKPYDPVVIKRRLENILAMKELEAQKRQMQDGDTEAIHRNQNDHLIHELEEKVHMYHKMADMVNYNKDNQDMLVEIAGKMHQEAENLARVITEKI